MLLPGPVAELDLEREPKVLDVNVLSRRDVLLHLVRRRLKFHALPRANLIQNLFPISFMLSFLSFFVLIIFLYTKIIYFLFVIIVM